MDASSAATRQLQATGLPEFTADESAAATVKLETAFPNYEDGELLTADLRESPFNKRRDYGDLASLAGSLAIHGVLEPLLVRTKPATDLREWEIVVGHRRFRAAKLAGLVKLPCRIVELSDSQVQELQLVENLQRKDVNPIEEAEGYAELHQVHHFTVQQIADRVKKKAGTIYGRLKLLQLLPEGRRAVQDGELDQTVATALARIGDLDVQGVALKVVKTLNARDALEFLQRDFTRSLKGAPFDVDDPFLVPEAGSCKTCPKRTGHTKGLFDYLKAPGNETCTHTACFEGKARAAWDLKATEAKAGGLKVLSAEDSARIFNGDRLHYGVPFVLADAPSEDDPKRRTWRQLVKAAAEKLEHVPQVVLAADGKLVAHELFERDPVLRALALAGQKWAQKEVVEEKRHEAAEKGVATRKANQNKDAKLREQVTEQVITAIATKVDAGLGLFELRLICKALEAERDQVASFEALGVPAREQVKWVEKKADAVALGRFVLHVFLTDTFSRNWTGYADGFEELAKHYGIDVEKVEAALKADAEKPKKAARR